MAGSGQSFQEKSIMTRKSLNAEPATKEKLKGGAPPNDQDAKRRLGNFTTAGEHARQGGRSTGIVGQTKQKNKTDKKSK
jgi:hypothetical protein